MFSQPGCAKGDNPMCGDRVQVWLKVSPDHAIAEAGFEARGCAISVASADLMAETVRGRSPADAKALFAAFRNMVRTGECPACAAALAEPLERLKPLSGVHEYPSALDQEPLGAAQALGVRASGPLPGVERLPDVRRRRLVRGKASQFLADDVRADDIEPRGVRQLPRECGFARAGETRHE